MLGYDVWGCPICTKLKDAANAFNEPENKELAKHSVCNCCASDLKKGKNVKNNFVLLQDQSKKSQCPWSTDNYECKKIFLEPNALWEHLRNHHFESNGNNEVPLSLKAWRATPEIQERRQMNMATKFKQASQGEIA